VLHEGDVPVEQEAELEVCNFEIRQQLGLMNRQKFFHGFVFNDHHLIHRHVDSEAQVNFDFLIRHREWHFTGHHMAGFFKVVGEALLVDGFQQPGAECLVHVNGEVDDGFGYVFNVFHLSFFLNREGARDAKGDVCWFILILEERPRIKIPKPCGQLGLSIT